MCLYVTFSVVKVFYNQNLYEVDDSDCDEIVRKLQSVMQKCRIQLKKKDIVYIEICEIHYSKNILLQSRATTKAFQTLKTGY